MCWIKKKGGGGVEKSVHTLVLLLLGDLMKVRLFLFFVIVLSADWFIVEILFDCSPKDFSAARGSHAGLGSSNFSFEFHKNQIGLKIIAGFWSSQRKNNVYSVHSNHWKIK
jgi:hypothetical protein